jgi:hypothetical protein
MDGATLVNQCPPAPGNLGGGCDIPGLGKGRRAKMRRTGIFATEEEREDIEVMSDRARQTPVITFNVGNPDMVARAWSLVHKRIHMTAMSHELPEITGYYGFDIETGEFIDND